MNLVHNAFEAQGTRRREHDGAQPSKCASPRAPTDAGDVEVSVSDLGPGLAGEVEQKIFEPFFTTKATGTGLGLAISRSIIKAHDARLGYRANQPRGACFYFVLPAHQEITAMKDLPQTVFVVDDDDAVRNSLRMLLKSAGVACGGLRVRAGIPLRRTTRRSPAAWCSTCACRA